jgi:putative toxin-antitoxin system antitoxin component (TIGR02293 family)
MPLTGKTTTPQLPGTKRGSIAANVSRLMEAGHHSNLGALVSDRVNYVFIYKASAQDRIHFVKNGVRASLAKMIVSDLAMPATLAYEALDLPISTINRKAKTDAVLRSDEGERVLGLAKLVGQVESMVQGADGAEDFDARAWTSRWLREPVPALGGVAPLDYMDTMEGQALVSDTLARIQSGAYG